MSQLDSVAPVLAEQPVTMFQLCERDSEVRRQIGHTKRFLERWTTDPAFKDAVRQNPAAAVRAHAIDVDPEEIRPLYDRAFAIRQLEERPPEEAPLAVRRYRKFISEKIAWRGRIRHESSPARSPFREWRSAQVARANLQLSSFYNEQIVHASVALELSDGCSVGCWFCGVGAAGLRGHFRYTPEHRKLWRDTLEVVKDVCGDGAKWGFAYWASDPLDNPDYEQFCLDYHDILGLFPQTTTAISMKDPERTRRILGISRARGCRINRFSVLTLRIFNQIHEAFSAEDLVFVELVTQNKEADLVKSNAGHFRKNNRKNPMLQRREMQKLRAAMIAGGVDVTEGTPEEMIVQPGTTACVTGLLFNMVKRRVKLISPCYASERWPLGYIVFAEGSFGDRRDLEAVLAEMLRNSVSAGAPRERDARLLEGLEYRESPDGFSLYGRADKVEFRNTRSAAYLHALGRQLKEGRMTPGELALTAVYQFGVPEERTLSLIDEVWKVGALDLEPVTSAQDVGGPRLEASVV